MRKIIFFLIVVSVSFFSCEMFEKYEPYSTPAENQRFSFGQNSFSLLKGEIGYLPFTADKSLTKAGNTYLDYDTELIEITNGVKGFYIKALKEGETVLTARTGELETSCAVSIENKPEIVYAIETASSNLSIPLDDAGQITAFLANGSAPDLNDFSFFTLSNIITIIPYGNVCVIAGLQTGQAQVIISHPLSAENKIINITVTD